MLNGAGLRRQLVDIKSSVELARFFSSEIKTYYPCAALLVGVVSIDKMPDATPWKTELALGLPDTYSRADSIEKLYLPQSLLQSWKQSLQPQFFVKNLSLKCATPDWITDIFLHGFRDFEQTATTFCIFFNHGAQPCPEDHALMHILVPLVHRRLPRLNQQKNSKQHPKLTCKEQEILHWVRLGKTNPEIGTILSISRYTVRNHLHNIYEKLCTNNRTQAAIKATQHVSNHIGHLQN